MVRLERITLLEPKKNGLTSDSGGQNLALLRESLVRGEVEQGDSYLKSRLHWKGSLSFYHNTVVTSSRPIIHIPFRNIEYQTPKSSNLNEIHGNV